MNIVKLVLLAFSTLLVSILLVVNPANASSLKSLNGTHFITVVSTQQIPEPTILNLIQTSHPISDGVGCSCANCVQSKFQSLQGKLPSVGF